MVIASLVENRIQATVLKKIIGDKQLWLTAEMQRRPLDSFKSQIKPSDRCFYQALSQAQTVFILECKKASPSKGLIREIFDPQAIARIYRHYAAAISVLTDEKYFQGSFTFLPQVREQVNQPVICKDFIIDAYQIYLARYYQADAILLMLSVLNDEEYRQLSQLAHQLNMGVLTEASTDEEVSRAVQLGAKVIGINNRNLRDLSVDLNRVKQLAPQIPADRIIISESGIYTHQQVRELSQYANGFLIGSALMAEANLELAIRKVIFGENKVCGLTRPEDAAAAYQAGAIYGGLIMVPTSPRYVTQEQARKVMAGAPLNWVAVFRNAPCAQIITVAHQLALSAVQLHGEESEQDISTLRQQLPADCQIWRALTIKEQVPAHDNPLVDRYIFDHGQGGSGQSFDWALLRGQNLDKVILAGGINLANIATALNTRCVGLDINSGVESQPGRKDPAQLTQLFNQIRHY